MSKGRLMDKKQELIDFTSKQVDSIENYEDLQKKFYDNKYDDLVLQEQEYLEIEKNTFN